MKRTGAKFVSPLLSQKKAKLESSELTPTCSTATSDTPSSDGDGLRARLDFTESTLQHCERSGVADKLSCTSSASSVESAHVGMEQVQLLEEERRLVERLKERKEKLRKLKMVKMYRTKNDLKELQRLTSRWREVAQEAAEILLDSSTHEPRPSMAQLLDYLHIDHELIQYSEQEESFY